jgi:hypothetical protein
MAGGVYAPCIVWDQYGRRAHHHLHLPSLSPSGTSTIDVLHNNVSARLIYPQQYNILHFSLYSIYDKGTTTPLGILVFQHFDFQYTTHNKLYKKKYMKADYFIRFPCKRRSTRLVVLDTPLGANISIGLFIFIVWRSFHVSRTLVPYIFFLHFS